MSRPGAGTSGGLQQIYSIGPAFWIYKITKLSVTRVTIPKPNYRGQMRGEFACLAYLSHYKRDA